MGAAAWVGLACALALRVTDEALTGFLPLNNGIVRGIRDRHSWVPFPVFAFPVRLGGLILAVPVLPGLTPLVSRGQRSIRVVSLVLAVFMVGNALGHLGGSLYLSRVAPGAYSSPILLAAPLAFFLIAWRVRPLEELEDTQPE